MRKWRVIRVIGVIGVIRVITLARASCVSLAKVLILDPYTLVDKATIGTYIHTYTYTYIYTYTERDSERFRDDVHV